MPELHARSGDGAWPPVNQRRRPITQREISLCTRGDRVAKHVFVCSLCSSPLFLFPSSPPPLQLLWCSFVPASLSVGRSVVTNIASSSLSSVNAGRDEEVVLRGQGGEGKAWGSLGSRYLPERLQKNFLLFFFVYFLSPSKDSRHVSGSWAMAI